MNPKTATQKVSNTNTTYHPKGVKRTCIIIGIKTNFYKLRQTLYYSNCGQVHSSVNVGQTLHRVFSRLILALEATK